MKHIVIGGAGFIGSHIAEYLVKSGQKVVVIDNLSTGNIDNLNEFKEKLSFVQGDILDFELLISNIEQDDIIYHQAALPSVSRSVKDPMATNENNIKGTLNVLLAAKQKKANRVIFASSSSVYGDSVTLPKIETMPTNPKSPYALSKLTAEYYLKLFYELYGLKTISLRYFNVFGPRQDPNSEYSAVIPKFIKLLLKNNSPTIYGDGEQTRDFTYVKNVVKANILASKTQTGFGEVMNIACNKRLSLNTLVIMLKKLLGKNIEHNYAQERPGDVKHSLADISKAEQILKYTPDIDFEQGLNLTINYMKDKGD